jgi:hypothetical protein
MRVVFLMIFFTACGGAWAQETPKKTVEQFFKHYHAKDTVAIKTLLMPQMSLQSISERATGPVFSTETASKMLVAIATIPKGVIIEERLKAMEERQDGSLSHVWAPYEFYIDGKLSHQGVNSFHLVKDNGVWKISFLIDTRRR